MILNGVSCDAVTCDVVDAGTNLTLVRRRIAAKGAAKALASVLRE